MIRWLFGKMGFFPAPNNALPSQPIVPLPQPNPPQHGRTEVPQPARHDSPQPAQLDPPRPPQQGPLWRPENIPQMPSIDPEQAQVGPRGGHNLNKSRRLRYEDMAANARCEEYETTKPVFGEKKIVTAREMGWFAPFTGQDVKCELFNGTSKDVAIAYFAFAYFRTHSIPDDVIKSVTDYFQQNLGMTIGTEKSIKQRSSAWQRAICTDFLYPQAEALWRFHRTNREGSPAIDLCALTPEERLPYIQSLWPEEPRRRKTLCYRMYKPIISDIDIDSIFEPPASASSEQRALCQQWSDFIENCFLDGIEDTINFRIRSRFINDGEDVHKQDKLYFDRWRKMATENAGAYANVPHVLDIPAVFTCQPGGRKRKRMDLGEPHYDVDMD